MKDFRGQKTENVRNPALAKRLKFFKEASEKREQLMDIEEKIAAQAKAETWTEVRTKIRAEARRAKAEIVAEVIAKVRAEIEAVTAETEKLRAEAASEIERLSAELEAAKKANISLSFEIALRALRAGIPPQTVSHVCNLTLQQLCELQREASLEEDSVGAPAQKCAFH